MINRNKLSVLMAALLLCLLLAACGSQSTAAAPAEQIASSAEPVSETAEQEQAEAQQDVQPDETAQITEPAIEDGVYLCTFDTDGSMFHVNEVYEGTAVLTVKDGEMTVHAVMPSKNVLNLFAGSAEDAAADGAELISPTLESVTYPDGLTEEVHAFDIPVPVLDEEFNVALIGKKEKWYDHKVVVSVIEVYKAQPELDDGDYTVDVTLEGGTGRSSIESPAELVVDDGMASARIVWSSPYYDYMIVGSEKYYPVNNEGNSVFVIPVEAFDTAITVIADTTAMSQPHEIEYILFFDSTTLK